MTEKRRERLIGDLKTTQAKLMALLASVADDQDWAPAPDAWSFRDIAAHLATVEEESFRERVKRIAGGEEPHFDYYSNTGRDFSGVDLTDALEAWAETRQEIIDYVRELPAETLSLTGTHSTFGTLTLLDAVQVMVDHDRKHIEDLKEKIEERRKED